MGSIRGVRAIRPASFGFNAETSVDNVFQTRVPGDVANLARAEFDGAVRELRAAGIVVEVYEDTPPPKPDAVFPNNWVAWVEGTAILFPMAAPSRRAEVRADVVDGFPVVDLRPWGARGAFVEGTGSLVLDRAARIAYVAWSPRSTPEGVAAFADRFGYRIVGFHAALDGAPVYHTNVVLALGPGWAIFARELCPDAAAVEAEVRAGGREVLPIDAAAVRSFAGNVLALGGRVVMSTTARAALPYDVGPAVVVDIPVIERVGGGSARCMLAEVEVASEPEVGGGVHP